MRFPNLLWAIEDARLRHYELAARVGMETSRFSRCLRGRFDFTRDQRAKIANLLGFPEAWLFASPMPPTRIEAAKLVHTNA